MLNVIRKSRLVKIVFMFVAINMLIDTFIPQLAFALTGGPSQPEVQSFAPIGTSDMVDAFTGDFKYNIPLMDVGGYPINLIYNSGVSMDQEASWVGLGWNLNPGVLNRSLRGLPDDFGGGDMIKKEFNVKDNTTISIYLGGSIETLGAPTTVGLKFGKSFSYNSYSGIDVVNTVNLSISAGAEGKGSLTGSLGVSSSAQNGLTLSPNISFSAKISNKDRSNTVNIGASLGTSFNSRTGLKGLTLGANISDKETIVNKNNGDAGGGLSSSSTIDFGLPTYTPQVTMPMINTSGVYSLKGGIEGETEAFSGDISGTYSNQTLASRNESRLAYGYLHLEDGQSQADAMLDFNREKDGSFTENTPALPLTNLTYDIYSASGQGISGTFRPFRNDLGYVFDPASGTSSASLSLGGEFAIGNLAHGGLDISTTDVNTTSGKWQTDNPASNMLVFHAKEQSHKKYEPFYFKQVGELSVDNDPLINKVGGTDAVRQVIDHTGGTRTVATDKFIANKQDLSVPVRTNGGLYGPSDMTQLPSNTDNYKKDEREKRSQVLSAMTIGEAKVFGLQHHLYDNLPGRDTHMGEFTVLKSDGSRYVYGLPLFNEKQREVTFNSSSNSIDCTKGLVQYAPGIDNSVNNKKGLDHYYNAIETPAYAHSYVLTAILSPDYVDLTGNGPSDDDLGSYTLFTYSSEIEYKWRVPFEQNEANYNEVLKSYSDKDIGDDQGSYVYGEKQIRYLEKIENKNYLAIFTTQDRHDGIGVEGENGGIAPGSDSRMKSLDNIALYTKEDYRLNGPLGDNHPLSVTNTAIPIKVVHFAYDYSLCSPVPNNDLPGGGGKLTLTEVYFTYQNSKKGQLSPYKFYYKNDINGSSPPQYNMKAYDRWGMYKPITTGCSANYSAELTTAEYPYVDQTDPYNDEYAALWNLNKIELPSGGTIKVDYEADDYAYVQDKAAMQMFKIADLPITTTRPTSVKANPGDIDKSHLSNGLFLVFKLQDPITLSSGQTYLDGDDIVKKNYGFQSIKKNNMYFKVLANMTVPGSSDINGGNNFEFVYGYAEILDMGVVNGGGSSFSYGYIELTPLDTKNPIAKAARSFDRVHTPYLAWDQPKPNTWDFEQFIKAMINSSFIHQIGELASGQDGALESKGYGDEIMLNKSWIRLQSPTKKKKGGGLRVKKITIDDNWADMTGNSSSPSLYNSQYGQEYDYQIADDNDPSRMISSGVAAYEPGIGGDENPWRQPIFYGNATEHLLIPNEEHYLDGPLGETFFPSPTVGYRQVTVRNLQYSNVTKHATGYVVHKFYTEYDFPTIINSTDLDVLRETTNPIIELFTFNHRDFLTASQGYSIELNDMHGKPKGDYVYAEGSTSPISSVEYIYRTSNTDKTLSNKDLSVINEDGTISQATIGMESDFVADLRQQITDVEGDGLSLNVAAFLAGTFPIIIPTIFPSFSSEVTQFHSSVMTKVIRHYGILEKTIVRDAHSQISTENLAYDGETGDVLLTKTTNDFNDPVYSFNYPAHWGFNGMGMAYKNLGIEFKDISYDDASKTITVANPDNYFAKGDEVSLTTATDNYKGWVTNVTNQSSNNVTIVDNNGDAFLPDTYTIKIIRSGRRNQQSLPIGKLVTKADPMANWAVNHFNDVVNAEAAVYSDDWKIACNCGNLHLSKNDYYTGRRGNWRLQKSYLYLTDRLQTHTTNNNINIRKDGTYASYSPFWRWDNGNCVENDNGWTWKSQVTLYSRHGMELENVDALNRYSAATYGYDNTLPTAVSANAMYRETGFDGFEDYYISPNCSDDHFSFRQGSDILTSAPNGSSSSTANISNYIKDSRSHTGRYSIELNQGESVQLVRVLDACTPPIESAYIRR